MLRDELKETGSLVFRWIRRPSGSLFRRRLVASEFCISLCRASNLQMMLPPSTLRFRRQTGKRVRDKGKSNATAYYIPPVCVRSRRAIPSKSFRLSPTAHQENGRAAASSKCIEISGNVFGVRDTPRYLMRRDDDNNYYFVPLRTAYDFRDDRGPMRYDGGIDNGPR